MPRKRSATVPVTQIPTVVSITKQAIESLGLTVDDAWIGATRANPTGGFMTDFDFWLKDRKWNALCATVDTWDPGTRVTIEMVPASQIDQIIKEAHKHRSDGTRSMRTLEIAAVMAALIANELPKPLAIPLRSANVQNMGGAIIATH